MTARRGGANWRQAGDDEEAGGRVEDEVNALNGEWKRQQLPRPGRAARSSRRFAPLGWDWRIGMAALASFPAREVVVGTLGIIFDEGEVDTRDRSGGRFGRRLREASRTAAAASVFDVPVALSLMVFFALCCQCASTLAVIRRETGSWRGRRSRSCT